MAAGQGLEFREAEIDNYPPNLRLRLMLEITSDDIELLSESDLRTLVGLLCEADLNSRALSPSHVTWGGHQNAADGGLDVRVGLPAETAINGFIPRPDTGFQVKKENLPPNKIITEMCPSGALRNSIQDLADRKGAYIIVSSRGSVSDSSLRRRRAAMAKAVEDAPKASELTLDFYDRTRIATWVRSHRGLVLWVKKQIGKAVQGWQPYGAWSYPQEGNNAEFLLDKKLRIYNGTSGAESGEGVTVLSAIQSMRGLLRQPRRMVRLVGHSGVGKTRLVQSLFDSNVGEHALDPSFAFYTNIADGPDPQPLALASFLIASRVPGILIIDNCGAELHQRLTETCRVPESNLSIITVEYDIRDHQPEATDVFTLKSASSELITDLIRRRFPHISQVDAETIAKLSDGNARIAIALAGAVRLRESLAELGDDVLFQRLFHQGNNPSESLLRAAQACSLVYSFNVEDLARGDQAELAQLGRLVGIDAQTMYASVAELKRRELVQHRGEWRAVLPHALANRLASQALQNIPVQWIEEQFFRKGSERLLQSFSRRLSYLHKSNEAKVFAWKWLESGGMLSEAADLNELGTAMFKNVAPVDPELALAALERSLSNSEQGALSGCSRYAETLRAIAYDPAHFERAAMMLLKIAETGSVEESPHEQNQFLAIFISLFQIYLSGTHATVEQRLRIIESLLLSTEAKRCVIGMRALKTILKTSHFESWHGFEFGARSRDYGYWPRTQQEVRHWFETAVMLVKKLVCSGLSSSSELLSVIAEELADLWTRASIYDQLEQICRTASARGFWPEGWLSVRRALYSKAEVVEKSRLSTLEGLLRPINLAQTVQANVFAVTQRNLYDHREGDTAEVYLARIQQTQEYVQELGKAVAQDENVFTELLPQITSGNIQIRFFGAGLAQGATDSGLLWNRLIAQLAATSEEHRHAEVLFGFVAGLYTRDPRLANKLLDNSLRNEVLAPFYPQMQTAVPIDEVGVARLLESLSLSNIPAAAYRTLSGGRVADPIPGDNFRALVLGIAAKEDGFEAAEDILHMRIHSGPGEAKPQERAILLAGRELLGQLIFHRRSTHDEYALGEIARVCLQGDENIPLVLDICKKLKKAVAEHKTSAFYHRSLLANLFIVHPAATLDSLLGDSEQQQIGIRILDDICDDRGNPLDAVPAQDILQWCDKDPAVRYPLIAGLVTISTSPNQTEPRKWTKIALLLLEKSPDRIAVLREFIRQLMEIRGWVGDLSATLEVNVKILDELDAYPDPAVLEFITRERVRIRGIIDTERRREQAYERHRDERFE
jgi:hypothetical protein